MTDAQTRAANRKEGLEPMSIEQARTTDRWSRIDADKINDVVIPDGIQLLSSSIVFPLTIEQIEVEVE